MSTGPTDVRPQTLTHSHCNQNIRWLCPVHLHICTDLYIRINDLVKVMHFLYDVTFVRDQNYWWSWAHLEKLLVRPHTVSFYYVNVYEHILYNTCGICALSGRQGIPRKLQKYEYWHKDMFLVIARGPEPILLCSHPFGDMTICPLPLVLWNRMHSANAIAIALNHFHTEKRFHPIKIHTQNDFYFDV